MPIGGTAFFGMNQHPRLTTNYLNQYLRTGDPGCGVNVSTAQMSGSIVQEYLGMAGGKLTITNPWAGGGQPPTIPQGTQAMLGDPRVGPLYGGIYQYLRVAPSSGAVTRGRVMFWLDELNYIVTTAGVGNKMAGVALNSTSAGNWDFFQVAGIASVFITTAGAINTLATVTLANPATVAAGGSTLGPTTLGTIVLTAATASNVSPVELSIPAGFAF